MNLSQCCTAQNIKANDGTAAPLLHMMPVWLSTSPKDTHGCIGTQGGWIWMVGAAPEPHVPAARRSAHRSLPGICRRAVLALAMHEHTVYRTWATLCEAIHTYPANPIKNARMKWNGLQGYMLKLSHESSGHQFLQLQDWLGDQVSSLRSTVSVQACDAAFSQAFSLFYRLLGGGCKGRDCHEWDMEEGPRHRALCCP